MRGSDNGTLVLQNRSGPDENRFPAEYLYALKFNNNNDENSNNDNNNNTITVGKNYEKKFFCT